MKTDFGHNYTKLKILVAICFLGATLLILANWRSCENQTQCACQSVEAIRPLVSDVPPPTINAIKEELPQFMSDITFFVSFSYRDAVKDLPPTRVFRAGERFLRHERAANLAEGRSEVVIKNEKDNWILNLFNKDALHFESVAQPTNVPVPLAFQSTNLKGKLLVGGEREFFIENNADKKIEKDQIIYELKVEGALLKLIVDLASDKPLRIEMLNDSDPTRLMAISYKDYQSQVKFNRELFQPPLAVSIREFKFADNPATTYQGWKHEDERLLSYYIKPEPQALLDYFKTSTSNSLPQPRTVFVELAAAILKRDSKLIDSFVNAARQSNPEDQLLAAKALRSCMTDPCLRALGGNPFGFIKEGLEAFLATLDKEANKSGGAQQGRPLVAEMVDRKLAEFVISGDKDSLSKVLSYLDGRIDLKSEGGKVATNLLSLDSAPPGMVDVIIKLAKADPTVKTFLETKSQAKSRSAAEILQRL